jgi:hypothetical protein
VELSRILGRVRKKSNFLVKLTTFLAPSITPASQSPCTVREKMISLFSQQQERLLWRQCHLFDVCLPTRTYSSPSLHHQVQLRSSLRWSLRQQMVGSVLSFVLQMIREDQLTSITVLARSMRNREDGWAHSPLECIQKDVDEKVMRT